MDIINYKKSYLSDKKSAFDKLVSHKKVGIFEWAMSTSSLGYETGG